MRTLFIVGDTREQVVEILERVAIIHANTNPFEFIYCYYPQARWQDISAGLPSLRNREGFSLSIHERVFLGNLKNDTESLDSILKLVDYSTHAGLVVSEKMDGHKRQHIYDRYSYQREGIEGFDTVDDLLERLHWLYKASK